MEDLIKTIVVVLQASGLSITYAEVPDFALQLKLLIISRTFRLDDPTEEAFVGSQCSVTTVGTASNAVLCLRTEQKYNQVVSNTSFMVDNCPPAIKSTEMFRINVPLLSFVKRNNKVQLDDSQPTTSFGLGIDDRYFVFVIQQQQLNQLSNKQSEGLALWDGLDESPSRPREETFVNLHHVTSSKNSDWMISNPVMTTNCPPADINLIFTTSKFILTKSIFPYIYSKEH
ncbi:hypothetical protein HELRODRAFT_165302 [Helobdella robusta]|uniref:Uncharacterized protein n=1 Tax=Helobdella robusta TaxID=6412 RepID=T1EWK4_HELRO|nr:hypothetical protein HELRODRAFT_165302 [Helobdella robusta]ESN91297.1 hypothetical protein HELRODRAFT_165302 [Helobdella robusta]